MNVSVALWIALFSLLGSADSARSEPRHITGAGFSYYVLSLYWLPTVCLESPTGEECQSQGHRGLAVHGLEPTLDYNSPVNCGGDERPSAALATLMKDLMPTRQLVEREWAEHGTCSGLPPEQFFALLRQAYRSLSIPQLNDSNQDVELRVLRVTAAIRRGNPGLPPQSLSVTCSGSPARLREIRVCLSKNLSSTYCTGEIIRSSCRSDSVWVPASR
jgi:ribonuclease T2